MAADAVLVDAVEEVLALLVDGNEEDEAVEAAEAGLVQIIGVDAFLLLFEAQYIIILQLLNAALPLLHKPTYLIHSHLHKLLAKHLVNGRGHYLIQELVL